MSTTAPLCIDCAHAKRSHTGSDWAWKCYRLPAWESPVTGEKRRKVLDCEAERSRGDCGRDGLYFVPRPQSRIRAAIAALAASLLLTGCVPSTPLYCLAYSLVPERPADVERECCWWESLKDPVCPIWCRED